MSEPGSLAVTWDEDRTRHWLQNAESRERQLEPVSDALFERAALRPGEQVLDVGCGTGSTTVRAAALVSGGAGSGRAPGIDVSSGMIAAARRRTDSPLVEWLVADAERHDLGVGRFDVIISRFGVMFFADPVAAFANLARACRVGGRLVMAVWRLRDDAPFFLFSYEITRRTLDRIGVAYTEPPRNGGPFVLGDEAVIRHILEQAGWSRTSCLADDRTLYPGGPGDSQQIANTLLDHGPTAILLENQPGEVLEQVRSALLIAVQERHDGVGLPLPGGLWIVRSAPR